MKKCLLITTIMVTLLVTLNACCMVVPGKIIYPETLIGTIEDVGAKAALLVTADGKVLVYNQNGDREGVSECIFPQPIHKPIDNEALTLRDKKALAKGDQKDFTQANEEDYSDEVEEDYSDDVCSGLRKGSAITNIQTISILKSNTKDCLIIGKDQEGNPIQVCWPR